ncbi:HGxxPAAW family protein [Streptomyces sp. NPDC021224]|uniref:HGxxPAAW family protein n=1 Tax=unclassified Streptomyces TaxID=2593676 RepID=UPI0037BD1D60
MAAHYDHGHTPAAWTGVIISFIGFCAAGVFIVAADPIPFWISIGVTVLGPVVGGVMKTMGMGRKFDVTVPATSERGEREQATAHA